MPARKKEEPVKVVKRRRPKASIDVMIKREQAKLKRLQQKQKLRELKAEVQSMKEELEDGS